MANQLAVYSYLWFITWLKSREILLYPNFMKRLEFTNLENECLKFYLHAVSQDMLFCSK
jgi:hypothetical protein